MHRNEITELEEKVKKSEQKLQKAESALEIKKEEAYQTANEQSRLTEHIANLNNQLSTSEETLADREARLLKLEEQLSEQKQVAKKLVGELSEQKAQFIKSTTQAQSHEEQRKTAIKKAEEAATQKQKAEQRLASELDRSAQLEKTLEQQAETIRELEFQIEAEKEEQSMPVSEVKKVMARVHALELEKNEEISRLLDEKLDLQNKIDVMETLKEYQGHMNQNQKIRYVQKIKEENNSLKKELTKMCNQLRLTQESHPSDSSKEVKHLERKLGKYKEELEKRTNECKKQLKTVSKLCEYILSRAVFPDSFRDQMRDSPKLK
jgi:chromosome segregation ATPase